MAFVAALSLLPAVGEECPHQGRPLNPSITEATVSDEVANCSTSQTVSAGGLQGGSGSRSTCPIYTTTGLICHPATGKWYHRVDQTELVYNRRLDLQCSSLSILWGLYSSTDCEVIQTTEIQTELNVLSDRFCAEFMPPPPTFPPLTEGRPGGGPVTAGGPIQPLPAGP